MVGDHHQIEIGNATIAEQLAREADQANDTLKRAYKRAARAAFLWPEEATGLVKRSRPLTELPGIGPYLEKQIHTWIERPPKDIRPPPIREHFLTLSKPRSSIGTEWRRIGSPPAGENLGY